MIPHIRRRAPPLVAWVVRNPFAADGNGVAGSGASTGPVYDEDTEFHYMEHCRYDAPARQQLVSPLVPTAMPTIANLSTAFPRVEVAERAVSVRPPWPTEKNAGNG
jgi:hypothetical protein